MKLVTAGLSHVLEADAKQIAKVAREAFEKYVYVLLVLSNGSC